MPMPGTWCQAAVRCGRLGRLVARGPASQPDLGLALAAVVAGRGRSSSVHASQGSAKT
jgi:hypothetical protein